MNFLVWAANLRVVVLGLSSSGLGRMIYAVGDNPVACRLAGVRVWQVLLAVYVIAPCSPPSAGCCSPARPARWPGPDQLLPAASVAAAVIGGTSILGGSGGYSGTIIGALILTVLNRLLLSLDTARRSDRCSTA